MKVCVIGLGEVGLPTATYIKQTHLEVVGYDINEEAVRRATQNGIAAVSNWKDVPECNLYVICVTTSIKRNAPDLSAIIDVCSKLRPVLKDDMLVSIESTIPPGTCRKIFATILNNRGMLVHVPHRYWAGDPANHGVKQPRLIGAVDDGSMKAGLSFYADTLGTPLLQVSSIEIAEMCKITENAYRFIQIAFAEELRIASEKLGLSFDELRKACNTKWNIEILEARNGIGGHCLPKDVRYFAFLSKDSVMPKAAIEADQRYKSWLARCIAEEDDSFD
jgi:UDP-N-acetyl-D-mannosaminuronic acid dehydrogenase